MVRIGQMVSRIYNVVNISVFDALSIGSDLVAAVLLCINGASLICVSESFKCR